MIREEIILKYLNNQSTAEESVSVEKWAARNPLDFKLMEDIFIESSEAMDIQLFDIEAEWDSFMSKVEINESSFEQKENEAKIISIDQVSETKPVSLWRELRPALLTASLLFVVIVAYFLFPRNEIVHMAGVDGNELILPDDTKVSLEQNAVLTYPSSFDGKEKRIVKLEGVAEFDITPNPAKPFIVETNLAGVKVLGTIFRIDATNPKETGVENIEGLINFYDVVDDSKSVDVNKGESFVYDGSDFKETTPLPEPTFRTFPVPVVEKKSYSVREIVNYLYTISNGHTVHKGEDFDWNRRLEIDLDSTNFNKLLVELRMKASITLVKKNCADCYEIRRFRVR